MKYYLVYSYHTEPDQPIEGCWDICFEGFNLLSSTNERARELSTNPNIRQIVGPLVLVSELNKRKKKDRRGFAE